MKNRQNHNWIRESFLDMLTFHNLNFNQIKNLWKFGKDTYTSDLNARQLGLGPFILEVAKIVGTKVYWKDFRGPNNLFVGVSLINLLQI